MSDSGDYDQQDAENLKIMVSELTETFKAGVKNAEEDPNEDFDGERIDRIETTKESLCYLNENMDDFSPNTYEKYFEVAQEVVAEMQDTLGIDYVPS
ncbi:hypothetical protein RRJ93_003216 [Vibrio parahaemolyticus]|nr:hypothetical protein [Vibrio parahaemolyticus]ELI5425210.1 hypothetical protein [Vibrio parahaemolyticus]HCE1956148.1 hypothetical protein [Vibrio parahaemolyticus]